VVAAEEAAVGVVVEAAVPAVAAGAVAEYCRVAYRP